MYHFDHSTTLSEGSGLTDINVLLERRLRAPWYISDRGIVSTRGGNDTVLDNVCDPVDLCLVSELYEGGRRGEQDIAGKTAGMIVRMYEHQHHRHRISNMSN